MAQGDRLLSCGHDKMIKLWNLRLPRMDDISDFPDNDETPNILTSMEIDLDDRIELQETETPVLVFPGKVPFNSINHHRHLPLFATASNGVHVWDETKTSPLNDLTFGEGLLLHSFHLTRILFHSNFGVSLPI